MNINFKCNNLSSILNKYKKAENMKEKFYRYYDKAVNIQEKALR